MATEPAPATPGTSTASTTETPTTAKPGEGEQEQQPPTVDTTGQEQQAPAPVVIDKSTKLPDDHPLVTTLASQKTEIATLKTELTDLRAKAGKASQLETDLAARPTQESFDALTTRNERLEAFLQAIGGPISKALDSKTFTTQLFETDSDIKTIVKEFLANNPTATQAALGAGAAAPAGGKIDPNALLRAAMK
jgi:riboflavin biosynthesis pyrimidine reductase